jgi:hypothetical protein
MMSKQVFTLPYRENNAAITFEKGTAGMEEDQLLTTGQQQPQIL